MTTGVVVVVYGERAERCATRLAAALARVCPGLPVHVYREIRDGFTPVQNSRIAKLTVLDWTPFEYTCYLDADTVAYADIRAGFEMLADGWDLVITPSSNQSDDLLWHIGEDDRAVTFAALGTRDPLQLQAGVMFVARNEATRALFDQWLGEWLAYRNQDQGALLRALVAYPVKVWLLGHPWQNGAVIGHHYGEARTA